MTSVTHQEPAIPRYTYVAVMAVVTAILTVAALAYQEPFLWAGAAAWFSATYLSGQTIHYARVAAQRTVDLIREIEKMEANV